MGGAVESGAGEALWRNWRADSETSSQSRPAGRHLINNTTPRI